MADNWQLKAVLSANAESMLKTLKAVNVASRSTRKYLADVASSASRVSGHLGLPFAAIGTAIGGLSLLSIRNAVVGFTDLGDAAQKGALKAGMSVEQWQRMKYVAEQANVPVEALEDGLSRLNSGVAKAAAGQNKKLAGLFAQLGIATRDANGQVRAGIDLLPELADAFKRNENPALRARMGVALFKGGYAELLPLLTEGSEAIEQNAKRFDRIKGVISAGDIRAAKDLGDSFKDLGLVMKGFQGTVAKQLVPVIKPLVDGLVEWWVANKKLVSVEVGRMAKDLADYIKTIDFKAVLQGVGDFFRALSSLIEMVGGTKNALIGLVLFMNLQTIIAFGGLALAIGKVIFSLGALLVPATVGATGMASLTAAMVAAQTAGLGLVAILGKVAAAAAVGYAVGSALSWGVDKGVQAATGDQHATLGTWIYDLFNKDPLAEEQKAQKRTQLLSGSSQVRASGAFEVSFKDAPPGMRVTPVKTGGDIPWNMDVGYRSYVFGTP